MTTTATTFLRMFEQSDNARAVDRIRIPLFQRDYAQGRTDSNVSAIRDRFLTVLCRALHSGEPAVALDLVYGEVTEGSLVPLDGQQRLTTLFLLHWYVAYRADRLSPDARWTRFSYETRPGAELFTRMLVQHSAGLEPDRMGDRPSAWIIDQDWFLYTWRFDPTVSGMLVVIDEIAAKLGDHPSFSEAWRRLEHEAIWFHLRPIGDMGDETDLYIKMNSRGKPLTPFENFKALIEEAIRSREQRRQFALKLDRDWSDTIWRLRLKKARPTDEPRDAMDERFIRYFDFVLDMGAWRRGVEEGDERRDLSDPVKRDRRIAEVLRDGDADDHAESMKWLLAAFDVWTKRSPSETCSALYSSVDDRSNDSDHRLPLFFASTDLFVDCCEGYGESKFTLAQTLVLFATILHLSSVESIRDADSVWRLRAARNLVQATRLERTDMHRLVPAIEALTLRGEFVSDSGFARAQVEQERLKRELLVDAAAADELAEIVHRLEDHVLLQGAVGVFDLGSTPSVLRRRSDAFVKLFSESSDWSALSGALLIFGDYGWQRSKWHRQYGTSSMDRRIPVWRSLLTERQDELEATRACLMHLLDAVEARSLDELLGEWIERRETDRFFDWTYYFVKYPAMVEYTSGVFHLDDAAHRFLARRLRPGQTHQASKQDDPYLRTARSLIEPDLQSNLKDPSNVWWLDCWMWVKDVDDTGYRSSPEGFVLKLPPEAMDRFERLWHAEIAAVHDMVTFEAVDSEHRLKPTHVVRLAQADTEVGRVDLADRIQIAASLARCLIGATRATTPAKP